MPKILPPSCCQLETSFYLRACFWVSQIHPFFLACEKWGSKRPRALVNCCDRLFHVWSFVRFMQTYGLLWALNALNALILVCFLQISDFQEFKTPFRVRSKGNLPPPPPSTSVGFQAVSFHLRASRPCEWSCVFVEWSVYGLLCREGPCLSGNAWGSDTRDQGFQT